MEDAVQWNTMTSGLVSDNAPAASSMAPWSSESSGFRARVELPGHAQPGDVNVHVRRRVLVELRLGEPIGGGNDKADACAWLSHIVSPIDPVCSTPGCLHSGGRP